MPIYNINIKQTEWGTIEGVIAGSKEEAEELAGDLEAEGQVIWGKNMIEVEEVLEVKDN